MKKILPLISLLALSSMSFSQAFVNGELDGPTGISVYPPGWQAVPNTYVFSFASGVPQATADVCNAAGPNLGAGIAGVPHSGTAMVTGLQMSGSGSYWHEGIQQTVSGFSVGCTYTVTFWQAVCKQSNALDNTGAWRMFVDNTIAGTSASSTSTLAYNNVNLPWDQRSITFTATATTHTIRFLPQDDDADQSMSNANGGIRMAIDLISISGGGVVPAITASGPYCAGNPVVTLSATPAGGTWSGTGITNPSTGAFNPGVAGTGSHTITYSVTGGCGPGSATTTIVVTPNADPSWTSPGSVCQGSGNLNLNSLITGTTGGTWSGTGVTGTNFNPSGLSGPISITYSVGTAPCDGSSTQSITVTPNATASWTQPVGLCTSSAQVDLNTLVTGTAGGTWSGTGVTGNMFDPSVGSQTVTYSVGTPPCDGVLAQTITVGPLASATWTNPSPVCQAGGTINLNSLVTGTTGGTWSGTGVTGSTFDPSGLSGNISITYSAGTAPCDDQQTLSVNVVSAPSAAWTAPAGLCSDSAPIDLSATITGTTGGTFSGTGVTGSMFDPSVGTQSVTYSIGTAPCSDVLTLTINVTPAGDASWVNPGTMCQADSPINLDLQVTGTPGGTWSGTGVSGSTFNPSGLSGNVTITYTVGASPCTDVSAQVIAISPVENAGWTPPSGLCDNAAPLDLNTLITGTAGGTWSGTGVTGSMFNPAAGTQSVTYTVGSGNCQAVSTQTINVGPILDPSWTTLTLCASGAPVNLNGQITGDTGGSWSGTGVTGSVFDPFFGTQNITYSVGSGACVQTSTQSIQVIDPQLTMSGSSVSCFGANDGSATVSVTGGSGVQNYLWNPSGQTTATANNLGPGVYQVTVTDGGCTATGSIEIVEPSEISLALIAVHGCEPQLGTAQAVASGGVGILNYLWTPSGQVTPTATQLDSAMHTVVVTDDNGCSVTDSVMVDILPVPVISTIADTTILWPDCIALPAAGGVTYEWTSNDDMDCNDCAMPFVCPMYDTEYCVTGKDANGCFNSDCVLISVDIICNEVFVPSAFSPNNDGENDLECIYSDCIESFTFTIYNRWGEKVFQTSNESICWDGTWNGKALNSAVFVYVLDGYLINGQLINQKGNISLIR